MKKDIKIPNKKKITPVTHFDLSSIRPEERFLVWRESISVIFNVALEASVPIEAFHARISSSHLSSLLLTTCTSQQQFFHRPQRLINSDGIDHFLLQLYTQGTTSGQWGKRSNSTVQSGDLFLLDLTQPVESLATDFSNITLVIPRTVLQQYLPAPEKYHGCILPRHNPFNLLLRTHLVNLMKIAPQLGMEEGSVIAEGVQQLIGSYFRQLQPDFNNTQLQATLRESIQHYIHQKLASPDLNPANIAAHFRMSRSHLYRLFDSENGICHYIQQQRLRLAFRKLRADRQRNLRIGELAFSLGFNSESHFCRSFQQMFAITPSAARDYVYELPLFGQIPLSNQPDRCYEEWVRQL